MINLEDKVSELVKKHLLAVEQLTEEQLLVVIKQAILAGDFVRYTLQDNSAQQIVYLPFHDKQRLQYKVEALQKEIDELKIQLEQK